MIFVLLACSGSEPTGDVKTPELTPPPVEPPPVVEATPPPPTGGASRMFELDNGGGMAGAPEGAAFILPGGVNAEVTAGPLSDGSKGMKLVAKAEGDALMCTQATPIGTQTTISARMKVSDVKAGPQPWMGLNIELRARDGVGALVSPSGARYVVLRNERAASDWQEWEAPITVPPGAVNGELCFHFVNSTGAVEVDRVVFNSPDATAAAVDPAAPAAPAGPKTRWELDTAGGGFGAPAGFDFLVPPGTAGAALTAGPIKGGTGFTFAATAVSNTLACSQAFPLTTSNRVNAHVRVPEVKTDARVWTGFVAEVRTYDATGKLVSPQGMQYVPVATLKAPGDWQDIGASFAAPAGATSGKFCFRFVESTGSAEVDWAEAGPG
jgi:hypothetical protein